ncbi:hypothetical protein [Stenotrophomonas ginsengisoli]|uniref:hypothetical protein n=1 Tax=Stenotrophomonas ginsengisoli TaxID=336566 RepID=UPI000B26E8C2|nr:hypothetical protein [Stenotrophomonas ginsengisoli]
MGSQRARDVPPTIAEAIAERLLEMKEERQTLLKRTKDQLARKPQRKAAFSSTWNKPAQTTT